ncbi:hypothetical protein DRO55_03655 [Candidatus Bathyarchaeota archaeon]|nr:MAG: hypothetical protein DRO55_03655 [Candidatus Bathyarchaeota archaeon]
MERWFERRRKNKILDIAYRQITLALDTVNDLERTVKAVSDGDGESARKNIKRLFRVEEEIDDLRRRVFEELTRGSLPPRDREDIMHLVKRLDVMADHVKDSARNILVLIDYDVPDELWKAYYTMSSNIVECASRLRESLGKLTGNPSEARAISLTVEDAERAVDSDYLRIKSLLLEYGVKINPAVLLILRDLADSMEQVADSCADTADYVRVLTVSFKR